MIRTIAIKEMKEMSRDGRVRLLGAIVVLLTIAALVFGVQQTERAEHDRSHAQERSEAQWEGQGEKNPHVAAHYGTHIFAPTTVATAIDPGVSTYMGRSVRVEAHKRNLASHSAAEDGGTLSRMGAFSVTTVLLQLLPLLIIALGYGLWSLERERGTLRQVLSTGVQRQDLFWGKALGVSGLISALLIPAAMLVLVTLSILGGGDLDTAKRIGLLMLSYGLYFGIFAALTIAVSAKAGSSRSALVLMIGIWVFFCLIVPRVSTEIGSRMVPLPSEADLQRDIAKTLASGPDGQQERDAAVEELIDELMAAQGMENAGLMIDQSILNGIELQAEATWEDQGYDHHILALEEQIDLQEQAISQGGWLSPALAMRTLSAGLCGTDYAHHRAFTNEVETWRKEFVTYLNNAFSENAGDAGWNYKANPEVWKNSPPFQYEAPSVQFALQTHGRSLLSLFLWFLVSLILAYRASCSVKVVQ